jgi:hypothetical protein
MEGKVQIPSKLLHKRKKKKKGCNERHYVYYYRGEEKKFHCSKVYHAIPARPSGKGGLGARWGVGN